MSLVRCTCVADLVLEGDVPELRVLLADPDCTYAPHRALHEPRPLATG
jgi:hypothetical protein